MNKAERAADRYEFRATILAFLAILAWLLPIVIYVADLAGYNPLNAEHPEVLTLKELASAEVAVSVDAAIIRPDWRLLLYGVSSGLLFLAISASFGRLARHARRDQFRMAGSRDALERMIIAGEIASENGPDEEQEVRRLIVRRLLQSESFSAPDDETDAGAASAAGLGEAAIDAAKTAMGKPKSP